MNKRMALLTGMLALQLLLAAGLYWRNQSAGTTPPPSPLVAASADAITRVVIEDSAGQTELESDGGSWRLPGLDNLPASGEKIDTLLSRLDVVATGWPITTSSSAHARFEVAEDNFQRRVRLYQGEKRVADFLLGTSPGFRKVHLRREGEPEVYAVELSSFEFPATATDWLDRELVAQPGATRIQTPEFDLERGDEGWELRGHSNSDSAATTADTERVTGIADAITGLQVTGLADEEEAAAVPPTAYTVNVSGADDSSSQLSFYRSGSWYYVHDGASEKTFSISQYDFERVTGATEEDSTPEKEAASALSDEEAAAPTPGKAPG